MKLRSGEVSGLLQWRLASNHFQWQEYVVQKWRPRHQNRPTDIFLPNSRTKTYFFEKCGALSWHVKVQAKMRRLYAGIEYSVGMRGWGSRDQPFEVACYFATSRW